MHKIASATMIVALAACGDVTGPPEFGLGEAVIEYRGGSNLQVVGQPIAMEPFTIRVTTYRGLGLADDKGETIFARNGRTVTITPFDWYGLGGPQLGTAQEMQHEASLVFAESGPVEIVVVGRAWPGYERIRRSHVVTVR